MPSLGSNVWLQLDLILEQFGFAMLLAVAFA